MGEADGGGSEGLGWVALDDQNHAGKGREKGCITITNVRTS